MMSDYTPPPGVTPIPNHVGPPAKAEPIPNAVGESEVLPLGESWGSDPATMDPVGDLERAIGRPLRRIE